MKNRLFVSGLLCLGLLGSGMAQVKNVNKAKRFLNKAELSEAATLIDEAVKNPETASSFDAWMTRGKVYLSIAGNPLVARNYPGAADISRESFEKAIQLDPGKTLMLRTDLNNLAGNYYDRGAAAFEEKAYAEAVSDFEKSFQVSQLNGIYDTSAAFNVALCAFNEGSMIETSIKYLKEVVDGGWLNSTAYIYLAEAYLQNKQDAEAQAVMDKGLQIFPEDRNLYLSASSVYIRTGDNEKASSILNAALIKWAQDADFQRYLGVSYLNEGKEAEAEAAFKKAIELNAGYLDAYIDLGNLYLERGNRLNTEANQLPLEAADEYEQLMAKAKEAFSLSIPYLEKIVEVQPDNINVWQILRELYVRVGDTAKAQEAKAKVDELSGAAE